MPCRYAVEHYSRDGEGSLAVQPIRVAVIDEHEIFRRGVVACLSDDPGVRVVTHGPAGPLADQVDVAVVSPQAANEHEFACPLVVCSPDPAREPASRGRNAVLAVLPRSTLGQEALIAAVRAAAAGLRVNVDTPGAEPGRLDARRIDVLTLLAEGADTLEISETLRYSERTIKTLIHEIQRELGVRSRAQAVAKGIREGLI